MIYSKFTDRFFSQLNLLLKKNITIVNSLEILSSNTYQHKIISRIANKLLENIKNGYMFSESIFLVPELSLRKSDIELLSAGENTGNLIDVLDYMCLRNSKKAMHIQEIRNALCYPCIIFIATLIATIFLIKWKNYFFTSITSYEMYSVVFRATSIFLLFIVILAIYLYETLKYPKFYQLYFSLAFLQNAGFTFARSLELCIGYGSSSLNNQLFSAYNKMKKGFSITESFSTLQLATKEESLLLKLGEKSESVPMICKQIAQSILDSFEKKKNNCLRLIEPLSLLSVGVYLVILFDGIIIPYITDFGGIL